MPSHVLLNALLPCLRSTPSHVLAEDEINPEKFECIFYRTESSEEPVRHWLKKLKHEDAETVRVIGADLDRVQWQWPISKPLVGSLGDGLYEVRSSVGRVEYRLIFASPVGN